MAAGTGAGTHPLDLVAAFVAGRGDELLEAVFAVQVALLLDEADVLQGALALGVAAHEVVGAPDLAQGGDERAPDVESGPSVRVHTHCCICLRKITLQDSIIPGILKYNRAHKGITQINDPLKKKKRYKRITFRKCI